MVELELQEAPVPVVEPVPCEDPAHQKEKHPADWKVNLSCACSIYVCTHSYDMALKNMFENDDVMCALCHTPAHILNIARIR